MCRMFGIGGYSRYGQDKESECSNSSNRRVPAQTNGKRKEDMSESEILAEIAKGLQSSPLGLLYKKGE